MRGLAISIVMLALAFGAVAHHASDHQDIRAAPASLAPLWVGPAFSGSWYSTDRSGEGFILQVLDNGTALLLWFTYPPAGSSAQQAWIYADGGAIEAERIRFTSAVTTHGGRFGATSGGVQVQRIPWGSVELRFTSCNTGEVTYSGPAAWGSGTRQIVRLTEHAELRCSGKTRLTSSGTRAMEGLRQRGGAWYNAGSDADGWALEELPDGRALIYWFTHDAAGEQAWTYGEAATAGDHVVFTNYRPVGTRFGSGFDASRLLLTSWGSLDVTFDGCDRASLGYSSLDSAFGSGMLAPLRLTRLAGAACLAQKPSVNANGTWSAGRTMTAPQSEAATATLGSRGCAMGNFPSGRDFQCYDAAANTWTVLAPLPAGRDHGEALADDGAILFTGGYGDSGDANGWRYDFATSAWQAVPQLPVVAASGAAMLNGFAYFGGFSLILQYNPRTRQVRQIAGDGRAAHDHSQVVAFLGEIWFMGGRDTQGVNNSTVSIFDPASETWRAARSFNAPRSGFAAAASPTAIFIAGGESLVRPVNVISSAEAIAAGDSDWTMLPALPVAVHGVGAMIHANTFITLGGSRVASTAVNFGDVQIYRFGP
jgi:hypothetical protein